jgi:hypothetical protein
MFDAKFPKQIVFGEMGAEDANKLNDGGGESRIA